MLHAWVELLPLVLVRLLAVRYCRRIEMPGTCLAFSVVRPGVLVRVPETMPALRVAR